MAMSDLQGCSRTQSYFVLVIWKRRGLHAAGSPGRTRPPGGGQTHPLNLPRAVLASQLAGRRVRAVGRRVCACRVSPPQLERRSSPQS